MKISLVTFFAIVVISSNCFGQTIDLRQTKTTNDLKVTNGQYALYFKQKDLIAAISIIDSVLKTNNTETIAKLKSDQIKSVDLNSIQPSDKTFIDLLKSNLCTLLLMQGKAAIYKGTKPLKKIVADQGPDERELDGTGRFPVAFSEEGSESPVLVTFLDIKLKS